MKSTLARPYVGTTTVSLIKPGYRGRHQGCYLHSSRPVQQPRIASGRIGVRDLQRSIFLSQQDADAAIRAAIGDHYAGLQIVVQIANGQGLWRGADSWTSDYGERSRCLQAGRAAGENLNSPTDC